MTSMLRTYCPFRHLLMALLLGLIGTRAGAGVLPEDRADILYHVYQGDDITVQGPALLVRKKFGESVGVNVTFDHDAVTGASIDSRATGASSLKEKRDQYSIGSSYLRGKTTYNVSFMNSKETDYLSDNLSFSISEDMFGDLTTVTLGFTRGWDDVSKNTNEVQGVVSLIPMGSVDRRNYRLGLSQILTKKFIATLNYESGALEGYLQNPYRVIRYCEPPAEPVTCTSNNAEEKYPRTRTSNAVSLDGRYYLPWRASAKLGYRHFSDSWGITGQTYELGYLHSLGQRWTLEGSYRYYTQNRADFYSDLLPFAGALTFFARDKSLATFDDSALRIGLGWKLLINGRHYGTFSGFYERIQYNYKDFRDATVAASTPRAQPLFSFGANVIMLQYTHNYFWWSGQ